MITAGCGKDSLTHVFVALTPADLAHLEHGDQYLVATVTTPAGQVQVQVVPIASDEAGVQAFIESGMVTSETFISNQHPVRRNRTPKK